MAKDLVRKLGTITAPFSSGTAGGVCAPFEIRTTGAIKRLMLRLTGTVTVATNNMSAVLAYGVYKVLSSIAVRVNQQPGPVSIDGFTGFVKNLKDWGIQPYYADVASVATGVGKTFEANVFIDFSTPQFPGGDLTLFKPKLGNIYTLEVTLGAVTNLGTPANAGELTWASAPTIDIYSQEVLGLEKTPNKYNASYLLQEALAISTEQRIRIPYGNLLNELHVHVTNASGVYSDTPVTNLILRNGVAETFRNMDVTAQKRFQDFVAPVAVPAATPAGIYFLDMAINNDFSSLLDTRGMKELEVALAVAAIGTCKILVNELRDGID
jgi:hypothetical protein